MEIFIVGFLGGVVGSLLVLWFIPNENENLERLNRFVRAVNKLARAIGKDIFKVNKRLDKIETALKREGMQ